MATRTTMTSRERMLAAMRSQEVDRVPCCPTWWLGPPQEQSFGLEGEKRLTFAFDLGIDGHLQYYPQEPAIPMRSWTESVPGEPYGLLHSRVDTPRGELHAIVKKTEDYPDDTVPFFSDFTVARYVKPWIATGEDAERFASIYTLPSDATIAAERARFLALRAIADRHQALLLGTSGVTLDTALWTMGTERAILASVDSPEVLDTLLAAVNGVNRRWRDLQLSWGAEGLFRRGWYDTTDFWSPRDFARWVVPELTADTRIAHEAGVPLAYQACTGLQGLLPSLAAIGFDCLLEAEPVLGRIPLADLKRALPGKSFWGGISAPMHIGEGTPEEVRTAVRRAFADVGRRGLILKAVPSIRRHWPWENVLAMVDEWRKLAG